VTDLTTFFNTGSFARRAAIAAFSRLGACWRSRGRGTALILAAVLLAHSVGQDSAAQAKPRPDVLVTKSEGTLVVAGLVAPVAVIGVGVYFIIQHAHTVTGCVSDDPNQLLLHTKDGKTYILLGATTNIKADTRIKVRGTKKKKIAGVTDQPSFVVEKLNKVYGPCSVSALNHP
jgi:hypothetical protein